MRKKFLMSRGDADAQPSLPLELDRADQANSRTILQKISSLYPNVDATLFDWHLDGRASNSLSQLRSLLTTLEETAPSSAKILRIVPRERYVLLNGYLSNYLSRLALPSRTKNELAFLSYRLARFGYSLVGDVVQMSPAQIASYAMTVSTIRNPDKTASRLEEALGRKGLGLEMRAPQWVRNEGPTIEQMIIARDLARQRNARLPRGLRQIHLQLVT